MAAIYRVTAIMAAGDPRVLWCGNLSEHAEESILLELFSQAGPVEAVSIAKDRDGRQRNYSFITYTHEESVPYAVELFRGTRLYDRTLTLQYRNVKNPRRLPSPKFNPSDELPQLYPVHVKEFGAVAYPAELSDYGYDGKHGDGRYDKSLSDNSLQGNWSRNKPADRSRTQKRFDPYRKNDHDRHYDDHRRGDNNSNRHRRNRY